MNIPKFSSVLLPHTECNANYEHKILTVLYPNNIYIYIYTYIHTYIHTHTYTYIFIHEGCSESNAQLFYSRIKITTWKLRYLLRTCVQVHGRGTDSAAVAVYRNGVCVWYKLQATNCNWILSGGERNCGEHSQRLCAVYESCVVDRSTVRRWVHRVKASGSGQSELHGYVNRKRADAGKACMPLFRAGVRP